MDEKHTVKEKVLYWLEKEESAFGRLDDLWREKVNTTGATTVRELFERYETERGPLSPDELKDLLRDLAYVHITCRVFPHCSTGLSFENSVTSALEGSSSKAAATGFQSSPSRAMVTGLDQQRVKLPKLPPKPSTNDWCPEKISGTMEEVEQKVRKENDRLKVKVHQLEQELEREKALKFQCQSQGRHLQQELVAKDDELRNQGEVMRVIREQLRESQRTAAEEQQAREMLEKKLQWVTEQMKTQQKRYDEKFQELENQLQENKRLVDKVRNLQEKLDVERNYRENLQRQLQQDRGEFQRQLQQDREDFQRQLQLERVNVRQQYIQQIEQDRTRLEQHLQQEREYLREQCRQQIQHIERVAEENCARHQQPETRTWIIQRNEVVPSNQVLGEGSWGIVREGTFRGSPVAVKELHSVILSPHNRRLFEREMEISSRCRHFNILQFIGATSDDENPLLVTELLDCNLRQLLEERQLYPGEIVSLALDVARGLNYLHCNQPPIVHRDIKSDNVLLKRWDKSWKAKVSDFGAASFLRRIMTPNQGTPLYCAPESSTEQHSQPADVYSFGLLLLEMCIRQFPVPDQIPDQIKLVPYPELKDLIVRCVQQVPERRASMEEVIQFLTRLTE